ncbi:unnamed protein product [Trichobilharzia szidati]|nr:unnamed protein product [Trichobilharzia szidati]
MNGSLYEDSDDEYYDCQTEARFYAVASPRDKGHGEVFVDPKKAYLKLRGIKGARLKLFNNHIDANKYADTPVDDDKLINPYPASPKPDIESSPYPNVTQQTLIRFRSLISSGDVQSVQRMVDENPMVLVTSCDTPTILQIRFRYNAFHVIASNGNVALLHLLLNYFDSDTFWERIYPNVSKEASYWRQQYVLDLYLNSPELGNYETPLHFASKHGHIECVAVLARHPLTKINPLNGSGQTPADLAASRLMNTRGKSQSDVNSFNEIADQIRQILDESYIVLVDIENSGSSIIQTKILPPLDTRKFQALLSQCGITSNACRTFTSITSVKPYPTAQNNNSLSSKQPSDLYESSAIQRQSILDEYDGQLKRLRGFSGPMPSNTAVELRKKWIQYNMPNATDCKVFSRIRLIDAERGYERQGRYLSRLFGTQWYEYWEFLDDFIDLNTEKGLFALEDYLSNHQLLKNKYSSTLNNCNADALNPTNQNYNGSNNCNAIDEINYSLSPTSTPLFNQDDDDNDDVFPCGTPVRRSTASVNNTASKSNIDLNNNERWLSYRQKRGCIHDLNDSLEESTDQSNSSILSHEEISDSDEPIPRKVTESPIVGLLKRLTFLSPLHWLKSTSKGGGGNENTQTSLDKSITSENNTSAKQELVNSASKPGVTNKRRISATSIQRSHSSTDEPDVKKPSPEKAKRHSNRQEKEDNDPDATTAAAATVYLPHYLIDIYRALPGNENELNSFNPPNLFEKKEKKNPSSSLSLSPCPHPQPASTAAAASAALDISKFPNCSQLNEYIHAQLYKTSVKS